MEISTILGIVFGFFMLILGFILEKGEVHALFLLSPALIVFGGTLGAIMVSFRMKDVRKLPQYFMDAVKFKKASTEKTFQILMKLSEMARKEGLLSIEKYIDSPEIVNQADPMLIKGMNLVIDGHDADLIRDTLELHTHVLREQKKVAISIFEAAGGYSPTMGIIGTVMGLVHVLGNLSNPQELAPAIAAAFIATLYGVCFANLVYLPIAGKLKLKMKLESMESEFIIEGVLGIQAGQNPRILKEKLNVFLEDQAKRQNAVDDVAASKEETIDG